MMFRTDTPARLVRIAAVLAGFAAVPALGTVAAADGTTIWVEGESATRTTAKRHPWYGGQVRKGELSGGDFLSHFSDLGPAQASYRVTIPKGGPYEFWVRANPIGARLSFRLNGGAWSRIDLEKDQQGNTNIADDGKPDLRFLAWVRVGRAELKGGANVVEFRMDSPNSNHGALDCFVFSDGPFAPDGIARPGQQAPAGEGDRGWFPFAPPEDPFRPASAIDLRSLNEKEAGDGGFLAAKGGRFVHAKTGEPVRFWAVNGPSESARDAESLAREARVLAKHGVNLVRVHHGYYDNKGEFDPKWVEHAREVVRAMKAEGIYSHLSIYFPLWLEPAPGTDWLPGYDGKRHPFAALMFNPNFQERYRSWWKALLLTPDPKTGKRLVDEPAVAGVEIQNEDSFFFWTFDSNQIPDAQLRLIEAKFGDWLKGPYGSARAAIRHWGGDTAVARDDPAAGRVGFRPLWNLANQRTPRDRDTARFLAETQRDFYRDHVNYLRDLGFRGMITASNWATASPEVLGPIEKWTYSQGDFIDRHGYFSGLHRGEDTWSLREGHVFSDRSALRFDPAEPGKPKLFSHPAMDPKYGGKPSMISETTFNRPNRYRSEAPLYYAAYGALQGSDAIVHFAFDTGRWSVKPGYFMQPWTLMSPAMMGQFPAAALIYRKSLVAEGDLLAEVNLPPAEILALKGTPLPQDAALDELRLADVPRGGPAALKPGQVIDPLIHYAGRATVRFDEGAATAKVKDLRPYIDRAKQTVRSTHGQLRLDYGAGLLRIDAPAAQGASGDLKAAGTIDLTDLSVSSGRDLAHIVAVSLDGRPLATSRRMLLQVMTEERPTGFRASPAAGGAQTIASLGRDPWRVREFDGVVRLRRADAGALKVTALDPNGDPLEGSAGASEIRLRKDVLYYLIEAPGTPAAGGP